MKVYRWLKTPAGTFIGVLAVFALILWPGQILIRHPMTNSDMLTIAVVGLATAGVCAAQIAVRSRRQSRPVISGRGK